MNVKCMWANGAIGYLVDNLCFAKQLHLVCLFFFDKRTAIMQPESFQKKHLANSKLLQICTFNKLPSYSVEKMIKEGKFFYPIVWNSTIDQSHKICVQLWSSTIFQLVSKARMMEQR